MKSRIALRTVGILMGALTLGSCGAASDTSPPPGDTSGAGGNTDPNVTSSGAAGSSVSGGGSGNTGGSSGIGGSGPGASGSGGLGTGASGAGGSSGAAGAKRDGGVPEAGGDARTQEGDAGAGGPSLCTPGKYLICENFESTAEGAVPTGWTKHGEASVRAAEAARGTHALRMSAAANGERRIYTDAARLGGGHWGRIFYKVELPVPTVFVHSTLVALQGVGPTRGPEEVRVVDTVKDATGKHQFLYNVQPNGAEFGTGSAYNWTFDGKWHCAEWHIDGPSQSYHFYFEGAEVTSIALDNGPMNYAGTDIPPSFSQVRVGWNNYQSASPGFVAWIDEVALDVNRIGCGN